MGVIPPDVSYARSGDVAIAYQVVGSGPVDSVFVRGVAGDLLSTWDQPLLVRHVQGLAQSGRVLMLDKRGTGLSDRVREVQSLDTAMDDIRAVMDAAGSDRAVLWSGATSTGLAVLLAATHPDRCVGLVLFDPRIRAPARTSTRGPTPRRSGALGSPTSGPAGEPEIILSGSRRSGRRRFPKTTHFETGSCGT